VQLASRILKKETDKKSRRLRKVFLMSGEKKLREAVNYTRTSTTF